MFIVIEKITSQYKKDNERKTVKHPTTGKPIVIGVRVVRETIRIDLVKSAREYHDSAVYNEHGIEGAVTAVYMIGAKGDDSRAPEIHINEHVDSFNKRIGAKEITK